MTDEPIAPAAPEDETPIATAALARRLGISASAIYKRKSRGHAIDGPSRKTGQRMCPKCQQLGHYEKTCGKPRRARGQLDRG